MAKDLVTRDDLRRALVVNALTKPVNVLVPAGVVVAGLLLGTWWLFLVAVAVYAALAAVTFFDENEAARVGQRAYGADRPALGGRDSEARVSPGALPQPIGRALDAALRSEASIRTAIADADLPFADVSAEVDALVRAMERISVRAARVYDYLAATDAGALERRAAQLEASPAGEGDADARARTVAALRDQLASVAALRGQLQRYYDEMEHLVVSLNAVNAQVVRMGAAEEDAAQADLAGEVRGLRESVSTLAAGLEEAYGARGEPAG